MTARRKEMTPMARASVAVGAGGEPDHVNATIIPFPVRATADRGIPHLRHPRPAEKPTTGLDAPAGAAPIKTIVPRQRAKVAGRVRSIQVQPRSEIPILELTIVANTGGSLVAVFFGRRRIAGVQPGARLSVEGMVGARAGRLSMLNPIYEILAPAPTAD
jgi:hypothetical protein